MRRWAFWSASLAGVNVVQSPLPNAFGVGLLLAGLLLALWATAHLGWRFGLFAEVRGICNTGPYRFLRHPMYVGYGLQYLGLALQTNHVQAWAYLAAAAMLQVIRAWQEEQALKAFRSLVQTKPDEKWLLPTIADPRLLSLVQTKPDEKALEAS